MKDNDLKNAEYLKEIQKIFGMTENEREAYIIKGTKNPELLEFAKNLQVKVIAAIGQRPIVGQETSDVCEKKYLEALEAKSLSSQTPNDQYSIDVELADMARTALIAVRWKNILKILGTSRKIAPYDPKYYIDKLYKLFENITKLRENLFLAQHKQLPSEYLQTLDFCYEQALEKYFDFFMEGITHALENNDHLTVNRLRIVCGLHGGLVGNEQRNSKEHIEQLDKEAKVIEILNKCIKSME